MWNQIGAASNFGFVVWVVYGILYAFGHWTAAALAGLAIMLAIVARETRTANVKIIDLTSLGFFVLALTMLLTVGGRVFNQLPHHLGMGRVCGGHMGNDTDRLSVHPPVGP